jgi:hypothetical protein
MWWQLTKPQGVLSSKKKSNDAGAELAADDAADKHNEGES